MPAKDFFHDTVKNALINNGWTITDDPLRLQWGRKDMYVDLGAERLLAAEKGTQKIAIEVKTFGGASEVYDLEHALGQYFVYKAVMERSHPDRILYLAVTQEVFVEVFEDDLGRLLRERYQSPLIVFDPAKEDITQWIN
ncbi:MAG TPA: element excision factor XisH family protein [Blastocatellia bacterium]|nr:element excision factor XisH family protein [Blastocatellia bacterium]HMV82269.1 element excision factor XisH family protein [Blastocatellia bacterium]HMX28588.1 element excision factor XisH family protein [Blastocatellia bacterium]HMY74435.1 element excision factor XisH family protein [Blastocatellia bacterium]HMZ22792.1 element excision factor XisH family protein [Blastocatellia bacterium]